MQSRRLGQQQVLRETTESPARPVPFPCLTFLCHPLPVLCVPPFWTVRAARTGGFHFFAHSCVPSAGHTLAFQSFVQ